MGLRSPPDQTTRARIEGPRWRPALRTFALGLAGGLLLWAAFPPLDFPLLAWFAPAAWLWLCRPLQKLAWQSYVALWLAGTIHWLLMLEGIRLAHPALYAGWIALAAYLGAYLPVFMGLVRVATQRLGVPLMAAAPIVWVGLELARGHLITGFSMGLLAHTQAEFPRLIQIVDLGGGYTLSVVIMLVAACLTQIAINVLPGGCVLRSKTPQWGACVWPASAASLALAATLGYGHWRLNQKSQDNDQPQLRVALIQGSLDTVFEVSTERMRQTIEQYRELTEKATSQQPNLDLVVWPESAFVVSETVLEEPLVPPADAQISAEELRNRLASASEHFRALMADEAARANLNSDSAHAGTMLLVGTTTYSYASRVNVYNSALLASRDGNIVGRYYKTHPVMFGEYIPFGEAIPWLYKITPMSGGLSVGDGPKVFDVANFKLSPSICFESTIPHLIRGQLAELRRRGTPADVLVNVTNDGWFWGTAMLDLHFRCGVFRAVENRKPLLVAANTGISTYVDGNGKVKHRGPKRRPEVLIAEVQPDGRLSPYALMGDWPARLCTAFCLALAVISLRRPAKTPPYL